MYHAHFGLERSLFGDGIATETAVFRTAKHDRLIAHFKLALASPTSAIVLHGPAGVGKTTLTSEALRASSTRLALAWVGGMASNAAELLELILIELGINTSRTTRIERLQLWRQFQAETRATDSRLFIVAERTEDLSAEVLHALDQLTAPDAAGNSGANLVLLGHARIDEHLAAPLLDSLRQRIRLRAELEPFTEAELQDYLRHQVACSGGSFDRIFAPGTVAALYRYTRGAVRLANTLCETALDIAAVGKDKQLTAELVAKTAVSLLRLAEPGVPALPVAERTVPRVGPASPPSTANAPTPTPLAATSAPPAPAVPLPLERSSPTSLPVSPAAATPLQHVGPAVPTPSAPAAPVAAQRAPLPVVARPVLPPAPALAPPAPALAPPAVRSAAPSVPSKPADVEYDGSATDVADVAAADFPVLTDAVEEVPAPEPVAKRVATVPARPPATSPALPPVMAKPATKLVGKVETAYAAARPAAKPVAAIAPAAPPPPSAPAAAPSPAATKAPIAAAHGDDDDDVLRQTQTMRAIAGAKSIDDLTELDAETLFSDAELDLVSAALASAAEWPDDDLEPIAAAVAPRAEPEVKKVAPPIDDPFDFLGLGDDAPLELIDDSAPPPNDRTRTAVSR
jgi:type II secretory pathway predicted ATPase ExeA